MKKTYVLVFLLLAAGFFGLTNAAKAATSVTQYGITWDFDADYAVGQFVNGDYYVVDPGTGVNITHISPGDAIRPGTTQHMNGSMINPKGAPQGYDGTRDYSDAANVGIGISATSPLKLTANNSLVSTISVGTVANSNSSYVKTAAVLTCLSSAPPAGTFRPGISGTEKTLYNANNLNKSLLKKLALPSGQNITASTLASYANYFKMVWLDHYEIYTARNMHPVDSGLDNYYFDIQWAEAALMLQLNFSDAEKNQLLINYTQLGIDLYSYLRSGGLGWKPNGGHSSGRKWPILFAGLMLSDSGMKAIGAKSGDYLDAPGYGPGKAPADYKYFGEDGQTFYLTQADVDITRNTLWVSDSQRTSGAYLSFDVNTGIFTPGNPNGAKVGPWNPDTRNMDTAGNVACKAYTSSMIGMPEWGITRSTYPGTSDADWGNGNTYRSILSGTQTWAGVNIAVYAMGAKSLWNHDAYFDYTDRYMALISGKEDPFGYPHPSSFLQKPVSPLIQSMWDTYRWQLSPATCSDRMKDGNETGIDSGGDCAATVMRGDADNNKLITSVDALLALRSSLGLSMIGTSWNASADVDVNCDGKTTSSDALLILRYALGLSMSGTSWCGS